ncbi:MAG: SIS domain-containing protein [Rhodococcus sp. (in: high G+C Gram-positive bacteria)]|nr:SIS domain-containing protein [Rhodococcus sp. (in: high G+C Gram-positive bacteria)]
METRVDLDAAVHASKRAIAREIAAVAAATESIDGGLAAALELLHRTRGKIIVSGIGKPGHIGKKIAATLASTGSPAFFIHSTEALHGDSGMVTPGDTALLLSNSGTTAEVCAFASMLKNWDIPIVAMTKSAQSPLGQLADVILELAISEEADPLGLAPTTSTTLKLVLGDALAIGLMTLSGFTAEMFGARHPGGALGQRLGI